MSTPAEQVENEVVVRQEMSESAQILAMIKAASADPNADIDKMERLMKMYREDQDRKAEQAFNAALQAVQREMPRIRRDAENKQTHSKYTKLETLNAALIPVYTEHGFSLSFDTAKSEVPDHIKVLCTVSHVGGHSRPYSYDSPITTTGIQGNTNMTQTHASGSALSYGRRYLTLLIFNVSMTDEDDDGNSASENVPKVVIGAVKLRVIIDGLLAAMANNDGPGALQIWNEWDTDEKAYIWGFLRSWERSELKPFLKAAQDAANEPDPNYIAPLDEKPEPSAKDARRAKVREDKAQ